MIAPVFSSRVSVAVEAAAGLAMLTLAKSEGHQGLLPGHDREKISRTAFDRRKKVQELRMSGLSPREIAAQMGMRYDAVRNDLYRYAAAEKVA